MRSKSPVDSTDLKRIRDPDVRKVFAAYPKRIQARVLALRQLILDTAVATPGVGALEETLKWNEPAYLTTASKSGSTIRIAWTPGRNSKYSMYFNCNTNLVDSFRALFPRVFNYRGNREIEFDINERPAKHELKICIAMALNYHRSKKK